MRPLDDWGCPMTSDDYPDSEPPAPAPTLYFIQHTRSFSGDSVIWWRANRSGYTFRIDEAGRYTEVEARSIERLRGEEEAFPVDVVLSAASLHVVAGDLYKATQDAAKAAQ